jgi:hypothetical protein
MIFDDAHSSEAKRSQREHKAAWRDEMPPELEWDESEITELVDQILCQHSIDD